MKQEELQRQAAAIAGATGAGSITPQEVGELFEGVIDYISEVAREGGALGVRKIYTSVEAMKADSAPKGEGDKPLRPGNLVAIYDKAKPDAKDNGRIFVYTGAGFEQLAQLSVQVSNDYSDEDKAKVKLKGREMLLVNVHLESFHLKADDGANYIALAKQGEALQLKDALRAKLGPTFRYHNAQAVILHELIKAYNSPRVLVCGDFNDTPLSYTRRKIGDGLKDAFVARGNGFGFTFRNRPFIVRIDHILYGKAFRALSCEIDKTADESDHYPISAVLALDEAFYQD